MIKNIVKYKSFMEVVLERTVRDKNNCWNWTGSKTGGYGNIQWGGKPLRAHRLSYLDFYGELDETLVIDHICKNTACVNPTHLEQVTQTENILRGNAPSSKNKTKTHCKFGHTLNKDNIRYEGTSRRCLVCKKKYNHDYFSLKNDTRN